MTTCTTAVRIGPQNGPLRTFWAVFVRIVPRFGPLRTPGRCRKYVGPATPLPKWQGQRLPLERTGGGRLLWPPPEGPTASSPQGLASGPSAC